MEIMPHGPGLSAIALNYDVVLSDIWGVIHNGIAVFPDAADALNRFRQKGGSVILISNASRLSKAICDQLDALKVPRSVYDRVLTSGDMTREFCSDRKLTVFDLGPGNVGEIVNGLDYQLGSIDDSDIAIASGALDNLSQLEGYRPILKKMLRRDLLLLCANPDVVTNLGGKQVPCSGAIAELYAQIGGKVYLAGKPNTRIFDRALNLAAELRAGPVGRDRVVVIGDSMRTDIVGAAASGLHSVFVTSGIHGIELGSTKPATLAALKQLFARHGAEPTVVTRAVFW